MKNFIFFLFFIWSLGYSIDCESQAIENNRLTLQIKKQNIHLLRWREVIILKSKL